MIASNKQYWGMVGTSSGAEMGVVVLGRDGDVGLWVVMVGLARNPLLCQKIT